METLRNIYQNLSVLVEEIYNNPKKTLTLLVLLLSFLWVGSGWLVLEKERVIFNNSEVKSTGVEIIKTKNGKGEVIEVPRNIDTYYVYTNKGAYRMEDNWFYLQFDSGDDVGILQAGKTYDFWHLGVRIPLLSLYENVIHFEEVK